MNPDEITFQSCPSMSAFRGKADITLTGSSLRSASDAASGDAAIGPCDTGLAFTAFACNGCGRVKRAPSKEAGQYVSENRV
jgi:hypothetical protein